MPALKIVRWRDCLRGLRHIFDPDGVDRLSSDIDNGQMPRSFYTAPAGARLLLIGLGCGVSAFRHAVWDSDREVLCIDRDSKVRRAASRLARELGLSNMSFVASVDQLELVPDVPIDLLLFEPDALSLDELGVILSRNPVTALIGRYFDDMADDAVIYRLCAASAETFHLTNVSTDTETFGKASQRPEVTAVVVPNRADLLLERCMESLVGQSLGSLEIVFAHGRSADEMSEAAKRWADAYPNIVRVVSVDSVEWGDVMAAALDAASGSYLAFIDASDWCESDMLARLHGAGSPGHVDMVVSAYWQIRQEDNVKSFCPAVEAGWVKSPAELIGDDCTLGRFLLSREFLKQNGIVWPQAAPAALQGLAFQTQCLVAARRVISLPDAYYNRRDQSTSVVVEPSAIRALVDLFYASLLRTGDWRRERSFKGLITRLYVRSYYRQRGIGQKIRVLCSLVDDLSRCSFFSRLIDFRGFRQ